MNIPSEPNGHPCPKPLAVWKRIMQRISIDAGETILDPFVGSGTTLLCAKDSVIPPSVSNLKKVLRNRR